jgi:putative hemolysin
MHHIVAIVLLVTASGFFAMAETALVSVGKIKVRQLVDEQVKGAQNLSVLKDNPKFLTALLIGNNFVNVLASALAASFISKKLGSAGITVATAVMTFLLLEFGEVIPKTYATQNAEKIALKVAKPIQIIQFILTPVIVIINFIAGILLRLAGAKPDEDNVLFTDATLKTIVDVGHEEGLLEPDEKRMINNIVDFGDDEAKDIMTPRTKIIAADVNMSYDEMLDIFREERFSRLPVYDGTIDNIVGVIYVKDLVFLDIGKENFDIQKILRQVHYTYESKPTFEVMSIMRQQRFSMTVVLDEYGGTSGIITIEDLVEEIVGDFSDEDDLDDDYERISDDEHIVDGAMRIDDVNEILGTCLESEDFDSIGGYVIELLERFPEQGEEVEDPKFKIVFKIEETDKNRIEKIRIKKPVALPECGEIENEG